MKLKTRNKISTEFSPSSMVDLIFLLLIFFVIMTTQVSNSNVIDMNIPKSSSKEKSTKSIRISINKDLQYFINSTPIMPDQVIPMLKQRLGNDKNAKVEVALDESVPHKYFVDLADKISVQAQYKIILVTQPK